jgi:enamine deaminase RidA (YjgF/YER057c/UK114 family)
MSNVFLKLPTPSPVGGEYSAYVKVGDRLHISGQLPREGGVVAVLGKAGRDVSVEEAQFAARLCAMNALAQIKVALGDFDRIEALGHLNVYVASAEGFNSQPKVADGASLIFKEVLGERGAHTRTAIGVCELPRGAAVEIDIVAYVRD